MSEESLFKIDVIIDDAYEVKSEKSQASMILFHGSMDTPFFKGQILPGGVDTQKEDADGPRSLSARYMIKGQDSEGVKCSIFVENNGYIDENGEICTKPRFITDSPNLKWLEEREFKGWIVGVAENRIEIHFSETVLLP